MHSGLHHAALLKVRPTGRSSCFSCVVDDRVDSTRSALFGGMPGRERLRCVLG